MVAFTEYPSYYTMIGNETEVKAGDYAVDYVITDDWGVGYKAEITVNNKAVTLEDWRFRFEYGDNRITKIWDAVITTEENGEYEIGGEAYSQNILPGQSVTIGIMAEPGCSETDIKNIILKKQRTETAGSFAALTGYIEEGAKGLHCIWNPRKHVTDMKYMHPVIYAMSRQRANRIGGSHEEAGCRDGRRA